MSTLDQRNNDSDDGDDSSSPMTKQKTESCDNEMDIEEHNRDYIAADITDRNIKIVLTLSLFSLLLALLLFQSSDVAAIAMNKKMAIILSIGPLSFAIHFLWVISTATALNRVTVYTRRLSNWAPLSLPFHIITYPKYPITSISELCATRGLLLTKHFGISFYVSSALIAAHVWQSSVATEKGLLEPHRIAALISCVGIAMIGLWELNAFDPFHIAMHCTGVALASCSLLALALSRDFDWVSINCGVMAMIPFCAYVTAVALFRGKNDDLNIVTRRSRICLGLEFLFCVFAISAGIIYVADSSDCASYQ